MPKRKRAPSHRNGYDPGNFRSVTCPECDKHLHHLTNPRTCYKCKVTNLCGARCLAQHRALCAATQDVWVSDRDPRPKEARP